MAETIEHPFPEMLHMLRATTPDIFVSQIHSLFVTVTKMDANAAVAGYQTMSFIEAGVCEPRLLSQTKQVKEAISLRMDDLVSSLERQRLGDGYDLSCRFDQVRGTKRFRR